jgi:hypothetical protein
MIQNFVKDKDFGEKYERIFLSELLKLDLKPVIVNAKGHDLVDVNGLKYEVKSDTYTSHNGNAAFELISNKFVNSDGWLIYSNADVLIYFISEKEYYVSNLRKLRAWLFSVEDFFEKKPTSNSGAINLIVPVDKIPKKLFVKRVIKNEV